MKKINFGILGILGIVLLVVFASGCTSNNSNSSSNGQSNQSNGQAATYSGAPAVKVTGNGAWTGNIADNSGSRSVDGSGSQTFQLTDDPGVVAVTFQKDNSNEVSQNGTITPNTGTLTVEILDKTGKVVATQSTTADAGVVSTSYSF
ncbi:hypothetical protein Metbo_2004 [Methanobacterium lacus]|uniref:Uncharacterized protein n=1 Tax=Methanobacterium lacus (strain AL-21) TaxID=877455 RepID=F0TBF4_METLA|nr:hypothetical protein [Methanobacterium lacus]ADZ10223.1 hypothetical protein Metbo_2004 [Methanobacterium lacus]